MDTCLASLLDRGATGGPVPEREGQGRTGDVSDMRGLRGGKSLTCALGVCGLVTEQ